MYIVFALVMMTRGVLEGAVMRTQQAFGLGGGFLEPDHFAQLFSTHGTIMVFFVAVPFVVGFINCIMPLQIGARDVAFPVMNQISLGLTVSAGVMLMVSLVVGWYRWLSASFRPAAGALIRPIPAPLSIPAPARTTGFGRSSSPVSAPR
jgi:cytochrome o ubiquinol oxidase subunit 1